jgi:hypothetical protein
MIAPLPLLCLKTIGSKTINSIGKNLVNAQLHPNFSLDSGLGVPVQQNAKTSVHGLHSEIQVLLPKQTVWEH